MSGAGSPMAMMTLADLLDSEGAPECDDCDGTGKMGHIDDVKGEYVGLDDCPTCKGRGFILEDENERPSLDLERMMR